MNEYIMALSVYGSRLSHNEGHGLCYAIEDLLVAPLHTRLHARGEVILEEFDGNLGHGGSRRRDLDEEIVTAGVILNHPDDGLDVAADAVEAMNQFVLGILTQITCLEWGDMSLHQCFLHDRDPPRGI